MNRTKFLGITVLPEYIQTESIDGVLDNLVMRARANAVAISPYVMEPAPENTGSREPPADAGAGGVRLLDRPLWGRRELWVRTAPSFVPNPKLYAGLRYQPPPADALTRAQGPMIRDFIRAAQGRHLKVYFQVQAAIPPGYRVQFGGPVADDQPLLPDGRVPPRRLDKNGSLGSPHIRNYAHALIRDLLDQYPDIDGLRFDWPEYTPYFLDDCFLDFSPPARQAALRLGFDFDRMRRDATEVYREIHGGLTVEMLERWPAPDGGRYPLLATLIRRPGIADLLRFKATLVEELLAGFRAVMTEAAGAAKEMLPNAFPPPFTLASGFDFGRIAPLSSAISVKLYTMHWPMMVRFWGEAIRAANPGLPSAAIARAVVRWMDIADGEPRARLEDYAYPEPDVPHPVGIEAQKRKIRQAQQAAGSTPVLTLVHGYGPLDDFRARLQAGWDASPHGIWINRYGYLTDQKLASVGEICAG